MKIVACRLRETLIPFKVSFKHALHSRKEVQGIILELQLSDGQIGYGECLPRDYVTGETHNSVVTALQKVVLPHLVGQTFDSLDSVLHWLSEFSAAHQLNPRQTCVKAVVELALLDGFAKSNDCSVQQLLTPFSVAKQAANIRYSGTYSLGTEESFRQYHQVYQKLNLQQFKVKVGENLAEELLLIDKIRAVSETAVEVRIDANGAWNLTEAIDALSQFAERGVVCCEQPMPVELRDEYPKLMAAVGAHIDICIDESLCHYDDAVWFAKHQGASVFNLRVSKLGGIKACMDIALLAKHHGIDCQLGAQVGETAILTCAGYTLSTLIPQCRFYEGAFGTYLLAEDITEPSVMFSVNGEIPAELLNKANGLGAEVIDQRLQDITQVMTEFTC
ncbi:mandelate racemase/muconate lactonizing enzyme family protein [Pseudoalteromonas sp. T1lg65]|uniref:mandelate racemase/muconate lactonizing enzyme family protein n=1 Tax=Pseudoalteromonas sp. T1lg65 TaxID=2077101 RepID=UPI003F79C261